MVIDWFGSLVSERVVVELTNAQVITENSIAIVHTFVTFKGISAQGEALRAMQNRFT